MRELTKTEMDSMLGRLVSSYGITHTVLKVEPLPYGSARLYIATDKKDGRWDGRWYASAALFAPGRHSFCTKFIFSANVYFFIDVNINFCQYFFTGKHKTPKRSKK